ncbi:MarR family winged helix-turn-helix transcriptional regulator [Streptomyces sp. NPDC048638]|uniref:MarR family winged helix-turn-helix transcriptional regulator n=1 Tax=Streptomyces sp. NPDC048638 TaxID=3365580 RepID=UPI00371EDCA7
MQGHGPELPREAQREAAEQLATAVEAVADLLREVAASTEPRLTAHGLKVMCFVSDSPGRNLTAVAAAVGLDLPRASRVCAALEAAGLLLRRPAPGDRREIGLDVSREGRALLEEFGAKRRERMAAVLRRMPTEKRCALVGALGELVFAVAAVGSEGG